VKLRTWITARYASRRALPLVCTTLVLGGIVASPAAAVPDVDGKFSVSGVGANNDLTRGPDGNVWVTLDQTNDIAKITPRGQVTEFNPSNVTNPIGIAATSSQLWVTQDGGVARFSPGNPNAAVKFDIGAISDPRPIVRGSDGNLWTVSGENAIRIPPAQPTNATSFPVLIAGRDIDAGRDGRLWVADFGGQVVRMTTAGAATAIVTGAGSGPQAIAAGSRTQAAYADPTSDPQKIGRVSISGHVQTTNTPGDPFGVEQARDRAYWFTRFAVGDLVRLTRAGDRSHLKGLGPNSGPRRIATGRPNTLWVTLDNTNKVARVSGVSLPQP
jgi:streptogramin lyase